MSRLYSLFKLFGLDYRQAWITLRCLPGFFEQRKQLLQQAHDSKDPMPMGKIYPCLEDSSDYSGTARGHYFFQDLLVAQKIFRNRPKRHIDIGSRVDGFVAHVASFREIEVFDIRPLDANVPGITFRQMDLMSEIDPTFHDCCDSLSCLHALEHFGLGRYGDPINYEGHLVAFRNLCLILKKGGRMYLSVPIGPQRIEFNAHRVFAVTNLVSLFAKGFEVLSFSYVDDNGALHEDVSIAGPSISTNFDCQFGCGIFELIKR